MELRDGMFAVKLCELEHQYGLLRSRLELCQGADHEKIRHLLADVLDDYRENALLLERARRAAAPRQWRSWRASSGTTPNGWRSCCGTGCPA